MSSKAFKKKEIVDGLNARTESLVSRPEIPYIGFIQFYLNH